MPSPRCKPLKPLLCTLLLTVFPALAAAQGVDRDPLADVQAMQERIREARQQGGAEEAWDLEQDLLRLVVRHSDDVRSARVLRDVGDHRLDTLARYDAGEFPAEIVLGCYYGGAPNSAEISQRGARPLAAGPGGDALNQTCGTGSRSTARRSLAEEALVFYAESARILVNSDNAAGEELRAIFMKLLDASYRTANYQTGRRGLESLLSLQEERAEPLLARAETLVFMGDWDLLFAEYFGSKYVDSATVAYERALALLDEHDVAEDAVDAIFSGQSPVLLPAFTTNRLESGQTAASTGYIEVSFEIRDSGRAARVSDLDSSVNAPRSAIRDLVNTIRQGRFRPIAANGRLVESAPVTIRHYISD